MKTQLEYLMMALRDVEVAIAKHKDDDGNNVMSELLKEKKLILDDIKKYREVKDGKW